MESLKQVDIKESNINKLEEEKNNISDSTHQILEEMKWGLEFSKEQIKWFETELWKRFNVSNALRKIIEDWKIEKTELQSFMIEYNKWNYDRYYTKNWEIKELREFQDKQVKEIINILLEKILENWYDYYSVEDINFLESFWYKVPENIQIWYTLWIKDDKNLKILSAIENNSFNDDKAYLDKQNIFKVDVLSSIKNISETWIEILWSIWWLIWIKKLEQYAYYNKVNINQKISDKLYQIDDSFTK